MRLGVTCFCLLLSVTTTKPSVGAQFALRTLAEIKPACVTGFFDTQTCTMASAELNGELFFWGNGPNGNEVFKTDGRSVTEVADLNPGPEDSAIVFHALAGVDAEKFSGLFTSNGFIYFSANTPMGATLFRTDGRSVEELATGIGQVASFTEYRDSVYFIRVPQSGSLDYADVYRTDADAVEHVSATDNQSVFDRSFGRLAGELYFAGPNQTLLKTDGESVLEVADLGDFQPANVFGGVDERLVFPATRPLENLGMFECCRNETRLFITDGIETVPLFDELARSDRPSPQQIIAFDERLYFEARYPSDEIWELYETDGKSVYRVDGVMDGNPSGFAELNDKLFFHADGEFYTTDGVDTERLDIGDAVLPSLDFTTEVYSNRLFFSLFEFESGTNRAYVTDGNTAMPLMDQLFHRREILEPRFLTEFDGELLFFGRMDDTDYLMALRAANCGDFDVDGDVDSADRTAQILNWTGAGVANEFNLTFDEGDCDGDGDIDAADQLGLVQNWTGAFAGNLTDGDDADLIYDPSNGNVTIDASDTAASQYASELGVGGTLDLRVVPEPSAVLLAFLGLLGLCSFRRPRRN